MKERPILFSPQMVRAILSGNKTQTRRVVKDHHLLGGPPEDVLLNSCPYGQPSDHLWVRERWAYGVHAMASTNHEEEGPWVYAADNAGTGGRLCDRWRPSIHMFRAASRITLKITGVRVERLQDISEEDAKAEGAATSFERSGQCAKLSYKAGYVDLWESINGTGSWESNPWVWIVEFKRI